jgi:hypothetical protein
MPRPEDFTLMWWADGPPYFLGMGPSAPAPELCLQSGSFGIAVETRSPKLLHAGRFAKSMDVAAALQRGNTAVFALPALDLELTVRRGGRDFRCLGRGENPKR